MKRGYREAVDKPKRFYKAVDVTPVGAGFAIALDGREVRTPKAGHLVLPTAALAQQVAEEWTAQGEVIEMAQMHATRLANTAIDSIPGAREATAASVAQYAGSDLLCYFAEGPASLVARQTEAWEPVLQQAERELGLHFVRACGIVHQDQPAEVLRQVKDLALELDDFRLAGLAFAVSLYGSAMLALAVQHRWLTAEEAFDRSRVDEAWQESQWGVDEEAAERTDRLRLEARMLERWFHSLDAA